ncbi:hypothetical protein WMY93_032587 [Mugilogobius chulae]|uniref:TAFH domain-containing protein n=1 Tax=Mugilogobius chulae TaxID=88201 RepID=A0AAW0MNN5_9GOBI
MRVNTPDSSGTMRPEQQLTIVQQRPELSLPPGMVLACTQTGQLVTLPQQLLAQAQAQQNQTTANNQRPATSTAAGGATQETQENVTKCRHILSSLIKLAIHNPPSPETPMKVKRLVQELIEAKIEPEEFVTRVHAEAEQKFPPPPYLLRFLKSLRHFGDGAAPVPSAEFPHKFLYKTKKPPSFPSVLMGPSADSHTSLQHSSSRRSSSRSAPYRTCHNHHSQTSAHQPRERCSELDTPMDSASTQTVPEPDIKTEAISAVMSQHVRPQETLLKSSSSSPVADVSNAPTTSTSWTTATVKVEATNTAEAKIKREIKMETQKQT